MNPTLIGSFFVYMDKSIEMEKSYDHKAHEADIYKLWEKSGAFTPPSGNEAKAKGRKPFTIIMPPPNANDPLHIGHAMFVAVEDILIRYHRMKGEAALWLPGTDHAGIETQYVYEKKLSKEGKSRFDFDRETLFKMIWEYVQDNSGVAVDQMKKLGAGADWSRFKFTLDPDVVDFVIDTFIKLHNDKLVYRGERLVNYCTRCGTGYSELEIEYEERSDPLYYMKYGPFTIATARPETKFRDTALAANPKDSRYKKYMGETIEVMGLLGPVNMIVIPDPEVDPEFGTGIMKVTPAHDPHDFELGKQHNLAVTPIIDFDGRMDFSWYINSKDFQSKPEKYQERAKKYHKMKVGEARKAMVEDLKEDGLIEKIDENYVHRVGTCYRCHNVIEPLPLPQFFIKTRPLADRALASLDKDETKVMGAGREKVLRHWLTNIRDWNISRQIVWGIRIPVWYKVSDNPSMEVGYLDSKGAFKRARLSELIENGVSMEEIEKGLQTVRADKDSKFIVSKTNPGTGYIQETDTFDTWFSSGQWPVVTLKTQADKGDFDFYYPTSVMETGYDILPIWVMRMMLLGIYLTDKSPFEWVYLHGLVRDEKGRKMSKSVGNVINPLEVVDKYGADAVRMSLVMGTTPGNDSAVGEGKIKGMRNFSNKVWNAARFVISADIKSQNLDPQVNAAFEKHLDEVVGRVGEQLDKLKIGQAAETVHNEFWHWYCDICIEDAKQGKLSIELLSRGLEIFLKLIHPFAPYVTEVIWQELGSMDNFKLESPTLISAQWPVNH